MGRRRNPQDNDKAQTFMKPLEGLRDVIEDVAASSPRLSALPGTVEIGDNPLKLGHHGGTVTLHSGIVTFGLLLASQ